MKLIIGRLEEILVFTVLGSVVKNVGRITAAGSYLFGWADVKYDIVRVNKFRL